MADWLALALRCVVVAACLAASVLAWHFSSKRIGKWIKWPGGDKPLRAMTWRDGMILTLAAALYALAFVAFVRGVSWGTRFVLDEFDNPGSKGAITVRIGGQNLAVPRAFLEIHQRKLAGDLERLTFELILPDISPNVGRFARPFEGLKGDRARVVPVSLKAYLPGTDLLRGLEQERFREAEGSAEIYGLVQFAHETRQSPAGERRYHFDFGRWRTLELHCGVSRYRLPNACVAHYSGYASFELHYEFADTRLADWRRIHDAIVKTVDGFLPEKDRSTRR